MEKVLSTVKDCYGEGTPSTILSQENGLLYLWEIVCWNSRAHNLGNCLCINHDATEETPVSTDEVIRRFGIGALDGFEAPGREQLVFNAFGIEAAELEAYIQAAYNLGINPLPELREVSGQEIVFSEDLDLLVFPDLLPGTKIFVVNGRGEISVVTVEGGQ